MKNTVVVIFSILSMAFAPLAARAGWDPKSGSDNKNEAEATIERFKSSDPALKRFFDQSHGMAVFPTVGKVGIGFGGAYGTGRVFEKGKPIGNASLKQLSVGFQFGGQAYSEIIFFKDKHALDDFKSGNFELGAQASAVVVTAGVSADADYSDGVAVFTLPKGGLMYEATVAGQKFKFKPD